MGFIGRGGRDGVSNPCALGRAPSAGPWEIVQCGAPHDGLCREDFMSVGTGTRYSDRACTQPSGTVRFLTWACREAITPAAR